MNNNKNAGNDSYADILQQVSNLLNNSFQEIKIKYADYPHCEISYFEKELQGKAIEIEIHKEITLRCLFDADEVNEYLSLIPDNEEIIHGFIGYLSKRYDYDFIKKRWITPNYHIHVKLLTQPVSNTSFVFLTKS